MSYLRSVSAVAVAILGTLPASAQEPRPTFEVASVKKLAEAPALPIFRPVVLAERGRVHVQAGTLISLVQFAYNVRHDLIVDGPPWVHTDLFEVDARADADLTADQMRPMMQSLLVERFGLVVEPGKRAVPHFALVLATDAGRLGPDLAAVDDCRTARWPNRSPQPPGAVSTAGCGPISGVAIAATSWMRAPVVDRTGLEGRFRYYMLTSAEDWPLNDLPQFRGRERPLVDPNLPTFREALRDQLGLRLESARDPLDVFAIKAVQQPSEN